MSKILFMTDTHLGSRNSSRIFRELFAEYYRDVLFPYCKEHGIEHIVHGGDFFENRTSVSVADIDYVNDEFMGLLEEYGIHMDIIAGNHDLHFKNTNEISSLSVFKRCANVTVVKDGVEVVHLDNGKSLVLCPWINNENYERIIKQLGDFADPEHILLGHFEIAGMKMYKTSSHCEHGLDPKFFEKYGKVLSGHFHHSSDYGNIHYLGALFHYTWADYDDWRGFTVYDTDEDSWEKVENPYCLFNVIHYEDLPEYTEDELRAACKERILRLVVEKEYDRVELKDWKNKIEKFNPIDFDIVDNTIFENDVVERDKEVHYEMSKEIRQYAEEMLAENQNKPKILELFDVVKKEAEERMKTVE